MRTESLQISILCGFSKMIHVNSVLQKREGEWVQAFGATISGILWVDKRYDWLMVALNTIIQSQLTPV